jgi:hypothetical protein
MLEIFAIVDVKWVSLRPLPAKAQMKARIISDPTNPPPNQTAISDAATANTYKPALKFNSVMSHLSNMAQSWIMIVNTWLTT